MGERFFLGFEKRANFNDQKVWKAKWHPEGEERESVHSNIHNHLKKNRKFLTQEGLEELKGINAGDVTSADSVWHPRFRAQHT